MTGLSHITRFVRGRPEEEGLLKPSFLGSSSAPNDTDGTILASGPTGFPVTPLTESNLELLDKNQKILYRDGASCSSSEKDVAMSERSSTKAGSTAYTSPDFLLGLEKRHVFTTMKLPPDWESFSSAVKGDTNETRNGPVHAGVIIEAQMHLLKASNESTVIAEVVPRLLPISKILLSDQFEAVYNSPWKIEHLESSEVGANRLPSPKPDVTIGFKRSFLGSLGVLETLSTFSTPAICCPNLAFPVFTLEAKGLESTVYSHRQNMHNAAHMLRNMCHLRTLSHNNHDNKSIVIFTASVSPEKVSLHAHWVETAKGKLVYPSREVRTWSPGSDNLKSAIDSFSRVIYESLHRNAAWIQKDLQTLDRSLEDPQDLSRTDNISVSAAS